MWKRTAEHEAIATDGGYVRWLGRDLGVEYTENGRRVVLPAEYGGDRIGDRPLKLLLWWHPSLAWDDREMITASEGERLMSRATDALRAMGMDAEMEISSEEQRRYWRKQFYRHLPWRARIAFAIHEILCRRRSTRKGLGERGR